MITITCGNVWANVPPGSARAQAERILRYRAKGYNFVPSYQSGAWDGYTRLMGKSGNFPSGLAFYLVRRLAQVGVTARIEQVGCPPPPHDQIKGATLLVTPRPDQVEAVAQAGRPPFRGVIHWPTGTGKTVVLATLVYTLAVPTIILCHRIDLAKQLRDRLRESMDIPSLVGMVGGGQEDWNWITVATFQSVHSRMDTPNGKKLLERYQAVMVDEVHHVAAKTFGAVMAALPNAYYRYGFSATPTRSDDPETFFKVTGWVGETCARMTLEEAVDAEHIVPADVFMVTLDGKNSQESGLYHDLYTKHVVQSEERNAVVVDLAVRMAEKGPVLVLVERIEHGEALRRAIKQRHVRTVAFLHGGISTMQRDQGLGRFRLRDIDILIATNILDEGIDFDARTVIMAGAGKAPHRTIQRVGRGTRTAEGKDRVRVFDFMDKGWRTRRDKDGNLKRLKSGEVQQFPGVLAVQANERLKTYQSEPAFSVCEISRKELLSWLK